MSFLLPCPNCGPRDVNEFAYAGEVTQRPHGTPSLRELTSYIYFRRNVAGVQREWWNHRFGCQVWFLAERDTRTFGSPSTCIRQLGQPPLAHRSPRGRWYLKLREKTRRPAANSADPIVSPSYASTGLPS